MKEAYRDRRGIPFIDTLAQDVRYALRALAQHRWFAVVAVLSLTLGIAGTTTVFSVMNGAMRRPLAGRDVAELVVLEPHRNQERYILFNPEFEALRERQRSLSGMVAMAEQPFLKVEFPGEPPSYVSATLVSGTYFDVLGIVPAAGRLLTLSDDRMSGPDAPCAAVISETLWTRRFARDARALGSVLRLRDRDCAIVGVAPVSFTGHQAGSIPELWLPLRNVSERRVLESQTMAFYAGVMGRLNRGVTREQAQAELTTLYRDIQALEPPLPPTMRQPPKPSELSMRVLPGAAGLRNIRRQFGDALAMMFGAVALVLLVAAINVANLQLARGAARRPELATRLALGASRWRLMRQLATEGAVIAVAGGASGVLLAVFLIPQLAAVVFGARAAALDVSIDVRVLAIACAATMATALIVGVIPAVRLSVSRSSSSLTLGDRSHDPAGSQRLMRTLIVAQFALSLLLVTGAGLLLQTSVRLSGIRLGFDAGHVVLLEVADETPGGSQNFNALETSETKVQRAAAYRVIEERLNAVPGVQSASLSWVGLFSSNDLWTTLIDPRRPSERREARMNFVSPRYFETVGMHVITGRTFTDADTFETPRVAVINQALARQRFGDRDPIGAQLTPDFPGDDDRPRLIVGVLEDARYNSLRETSTGPMIWMPLQQAVYRITSVDLRVAPGTEATVSQLAATVLRSVNPYLMVRRRTTLADQVHGTAARERLLFTVSTAFGGFALVLAAIGLHGTLTYKVARRTREIGVRLALGAQRSSLVGMLFRDALAVAAASLVIGVPLSMAAGWSLRTFLFGVAPRDPLTLIASCGVLALTVLVASCVPAIRASRVDPVLALKAE
ncbi:MAG TPA: ABC transporter permease [Vicinamibacterales bacterium]|nr:ABC transporter permease [Vicinamibacterales bacterium]